MQSLVSVALRVCVCLGSIDDQFFISNIFSFSYFICAFLFLSFFVSLFLLFALFFFSGICEIFTKTTLSVSNAVALVVVVAVVLVVGLFG